MIMKILLIEVISFLERGQIFWRIIEILLEILFDKFSAIIERY